MTCVMLLETEASLLSALKVTALLLSNLLVADMSVEAVLLSVILLTQAVPLLASKTFTLVAYTKISINPTTFINFKIDCC